MCGIHCDMFGRARPCTNYTQSMSRSCILWVFFARLWYTEHIFSSVHPHELRHVFLRATGWCGVSWDLCFIFLQLKPSINCFARSSLKLIISRFCFPWSTREVDSRMKPLHTERLNKNQKIKRTKLIGTVNTTHVCCVNVGYMRLFNVDISPILSALNNTWGFAWQNICGQKWNVSFIVPFCKN